MPAGLELLTGALNLTRARIRLFPGGLSRGGGESGWRVALGIYVASSYELPEIPETLPVLGPCEARGTGAAGMGRGVSPMTDVVECCGISPPPANGRTCARWSESDTTSRLTWAVPDTPSASDRLHY